MKCWRVEITVSLLFEEIETVIEMPFFRVIGHFLERMYIIGQHNCARRIFMLPTIWSVLPCQCSFAQT